MNINSQADLKENIYTLEVLYYAIGETLIQVQQAEWAIHGIVSIFNQTAIKLDDKKFKKLDLETFLSDTEEANKNRRHTLGQLKDYLEKINYFNSDIIDELQEFVEHRNTLIHNYYRIHFHNKDHRLFSETKYKDIYSFIINLHQLCKKWTTFFMGLLVDIVEVNKNFTKEEKVRFREQHIHEYNEYKSRIAT